MHPTVSVMRTAPCVKSANVDETSKVLAATAACFVNFCLKEV